MDEKKLIEISNIKNLQSIKISTLMDTPENEDPGVIIVFYEDGKKSLIYSELDSVYLYFFSTIRRVYNEEKNKRNIYIDELSKKFLESNEPVIELNKLKAEIGSVGVEKKINYKKQNVEIHYNILKYLLENLFSYFNRKIEIINLKGMGEHFKLIYKEDGVEKSLPFNYKLNEDDNHTFIFPGIFESKELYIDINYNEKIIINLYDLNSKLHIIYECTTTTEFANISKSFYINGILNSKIIIELDRVENQEIYDYKINGITYKLPWLDFRTVTSEVLEEELLVETTEYTDYFKYNEHEQIRKKIVRYITKKGYGKNLEGFYKIKGDLKLQTDDEIIITNYYKLESYLIKETT